MHHPADCPGSDAAVGVRLLGHFGIVHDDLAVLDHLGRVAVVLLVPGVLGLEVPGAVAAVVFYTVHLVAYTQTLLG
jgi:hypothetical protein